MDLSGVPAQSSQQLAGVGVPEFYGFILGCGGQKFAVGGEGNTCDRARMPAHSNREPHFAKIPDGDGSVLTCRSHPAARGIKRNEIYACQLQRKLAVGPAERRTGIVV